MRSHRSGAERREHAQAELAAIAAARHARRSNRDRLTVELAANNYAYTDQRITRRQWVERNRELAAEASQLGLGIRLPDIAVTHTGEDA